MIKMLLAIVLLTLVSAQAQIPPPEPDPQCTSNWVLLYHASDTAFCNDFCIWACETINWSDYLNDWYPSAKFVSTCYRTSSTRTYPFTTILPIIFN